MTNSSRKPLGTTGWTGLMAIVGLLAVLALAACGATGAQAKTTPTPNASDLLQQASKASYKDMTFTLAFTMTIQGQTVAGTGSGKATTTPSRFDELMSFPLTANGKTLHVTVEVIADMSANTGYVRYTGIPGHTTNWTKMSLPNLTASTGVDYSSLNSFDSFQHVTLIGADTINGVAVWHIQADLPMTASTPTSKASATPTPATPASADLYVRQDNDYLVKMVEHMTGATPGVMTLTVTQYDSGATITLPKI